jgi:alpha-L-rhamnosidase
MNRNKNSPMATQFMLLYECAVTKLLIQINAMIKSILYFFTLLFIQTSFAQLKITDLTAEHLVAPLGLGAKQPRLSWKITADIRNALQSAYEIQVSTTKDPSKGDAWRTGKVMSDQSTNISYQGQELKPTTHYFWRVRVWDNAGKASPWSERSWWTTGLLNPSDWKAEWIESGLPGDSVLGSCPLFRRVFELKKVVNSARLYITSHGLYEASLNGKRVGDAYLTPGWTSYKTRLQYQVYDITYSIKQGANAIGVVLGDGWYRGHLAWQDNKNIYGKKAGLLLELELSYADGTTEIISSDDQWKTSTGPILSSSIYHGERYDARLEKSGWNTATFDASDWQPVKVNDVPKENILASQSPLITKHEIFKPIKTITTPKGEKVLDFGQNLVGWVQFKVTGKKGDVVKIHHAEVLDKEGNFYTDNLRAAKAEIQYTLKGGGEETFEPHFTFFGFRYIKIDGYPGELDANNFQGITLYSDMKPTGTFECSNSLVNQLQHNIQWGQRGNFLDVPTDCPQRDEKLGWTGDARRSQGLLPSITMSITSLPNGYKIFQPISNLMAGFLL